MMALLSSAMEKHLGLSWEEPLSERLYYQLTSHYIPSVARYIPFMHSINLTGRIDRVPVENAGKVGAGCSGGVDSFYTIESPSDNNIPDGYRLTHLVYSSNGNIHHFYNFSYRAFSDFYTAIFATPVYALQKLFSVYYESPSWPLSEFDITVSKARSNDFSINDIFTLPLISSENLSFYSIGDLTRSEKSALSAIIRLQ